MGLELTVDQDFKRFDRFINNNKKQLPFATSLALNNTGFDMRNAFNKGTMSAFNKPTKFTQKAFLTTKSKKNNLVVHVFAKDKEGSDAARYLRFGVKGGTRPAKGYEKYFSGLPNDGTTTITLNGCDLSDDQERCNEMTSNAKQVIEKNKGSKEKILQLIQPLIELH